MELDDLARNVAVDELQDVVPATDVPLHKGPLPPAAAAELASIHLGIAQGCFAAVSHACSDLTGRIAHSAADFLVARVPAMVATAER